MDIHFREAVLEDLPLLVKMLSDDSLGKSREDFETPLNSRYVDMFKNIEEDNNNTLVVVEVDAQVVGMLQLTFIPYLTYMGSWRCQIEGVRVMKGYRGKGIGRKLFSWAIDRARGRGCKMVQLTSNKKRTNALHFYDSLGFQASHEGMKLML